MIVAKNNDWDFESCVESCTQKKKISTDAYADEAFDSAVKSTIMKSSIGVDDVVATSMNSLCIDEEPGMALMSVHSISMAAP